MTFLVFSFFYIPWLYKIRDYMHGMDSTSRALPLITNLARVWNYWLCVCVCHVYESSFSCFAIFPPLNHTSQWKRSLCIPACLPTEYYLFFIWMGYQTAIKNTSLNWRSHRTFYFRFSSPFCYWLFAAISSKAHQAHQTNEQKQKYTIIMFYIPVYTHTCTASTEVWFEFKRHCTSDEQEKNKKNTATKKKKKSNSICWHRE